MARESVPVPPDLLEELRGELQSQLRRLERSMRTTDEASQPVELDQQAVGRLSRMDSLQNRHLTRNLQEREQVRHAALVRALERMEEGTYGRCTRCGDPIPPGRLLIYPETEHCSPCGG